MQLVAYGAQDIYLTGNPQITFFKVVYRRHTNFSMEAIEQTWAGNEGTDSAGSCTATISRNGDLVYRMYLEVDMAGLDVAEHNPMARAITEVELEIGGQKIDKQTGLWMHVWSCLTQPNYSAFTGKSSDTNKGTGTLYQNTTGMGGLGNGNFPQRFWVPLQFWFCRNPGLALPLIALQYHEVKVKLLHDFKKAHNAASCNSNKLWCDYIYLDTDERRRFAQVSHEYLIEQIQETSVTAAGSSDLNFNHPIKELVFVNSDTGVNDAAVKNVSAVASTARIGSGSATYQLKLNGHDRFAERDYRYFSRTQVWEHHTGPGGLESSSSTAAGGRLNDAIGVYSFALKPEEHQPSGTCNFSRIDNAQFVGSVGTTANKVFAINYNVLRIMSGMGGLAYSN